VRARCPRASGGPPRRGLRLLDHLVDVSLVKVPVPLIVIFCPRRRHVLRGHVQMPLASMSKVTSTWASAGRRRNADQVEPPERPVVPGELRLSLHDVDLHARLVVVAVEKVSLLRVGIVVFRSISLVMTPPSVSTPATGG